MKDEGFRKLLVEYAEEMRDPEVRKVSPAPPRHRAAVRRCMARLAHLCTLQKHEEELRQMEAMQGNDVTFINPEVALGGGTIFPPRPRTPCICTASLTLACASLSRAGS